MERAALRDEHYAAALPLAAGPVASLVGEGSARCEAQEHALAAGAWCVVFAPAYAHCLAGHCPAVLAESQLAALAVASEGCSEDDCYPAAPGEAEPAAAAVAPVGCTQDGYLQAAPAEFPSAAMGAVAGENSRDDCSPAVFLGIDAAAVAAPDFAGWRTAAAEHCGCYIAERRDEPCSQAHLAELRSQVHPDAVCFHSAVGLAFLDAELRHDFREHSAVRRELLVAAHNCGSLVHHGFLVGSPVQRARPVFRQHRHFVAHLAGLPDVVRY